MMRGRVQTRTGNHVRMLVDEFADVVDLVVNDKPEVLLGVVVGDILERELLFGHGVGLWSVVCGFGCGL